MTLELPELVYRWAERTGRARIDGETTRGELSQVSGIYERGEGSTGFQVFRSDDAGGALYYHPAREGTAWIRSRDSSHSAALCCLD